MWKGLGLGAEVAVQNSRLILLITGLCFEEVRFDDILEIVTLGAETKTLFEITAAKNFFFFMLIQIRLLLLPDTNTTRERKKGNVKTFPTLDVGFRHYGKCHQSQNSQKGNNKWDLNSTFESART